MISAGRNSSTNLEMKELAVVANEILGVVRESL